MDDMAGMNWAPIYNAVPDWFRNEDSGWQTTLEELAEEGELLPEALTVTFKNRYVILVGKHDCDNKCTDCDSREGCDLVDSEEQAVSLIGVDSLRDIETVLEDFGAISISTSVLGTEYIVKWVYDTHLDQRRKFSLGLTSV